MSIEEMMALIGGGSILLTCVIGGLITVVTLVSMGAVMFFVFKAIRPDPTIMKSGTSAQATIQNVWQTGTYINNSPQVGMQIEVRPPNGVPYQTQITAVIPLINIPQFQPGAVVPVKIHPTDPSKVALDVYR
jgi:hypothetical protein